MPVLQRYPREPVARTVLVAAPGQPWALVRIRWWDRARAHLRSLELDVELAAGAPVAADRVRAVRAATLVASGTRLVLARGWHGVLAGGPSMVPVQRSRVLAAQTEIRELIDTLRAPGAIAPRGAARASLLLTDGRGPLFNPQNIRDLSDEIRLALLHLDPRRAVDTD